MSLLVVEAETLRSGNSGVGVRKEEVQGERGRQGDKGPQLGCGRSPRLAASPRACAHRLLPPAHLPVSASGRRPQPGMGVRCPADDAADHAMTRMGPSSLCGESRGACSEFPGTPAPPPQSQDSHTRTGRAPQALGSGLLWTEGPCCAGQGGTRAPGRVLLGSDRPSASCSIRDPAASPLGPRPCPRRRLKGSPLFRPEGRDGP